jgi:hypothetical protein
MAFKAASNKLFITHSKARLTPEYSTTIEVRLASGDVDGISAVEWTADSSVGWLRLGERNGTVDSGNPVVQVSLAMDSTGLNDTGSTLPLYANVTLVSRMAGSERSDLFENGTHMLTMEVQVSILAEPSMDLSKMRLQQSSGDDLINGGSVAPGDTLTISATVFDYEELPISRPGLLLSVTLTGGDATNVLTMRHMDSNTYRGEVPGSWIENPGEYRLFISSGTDRTNRFDFGFSVSIQDKNLPVALGITAVRALRTPRHVVRLRAAQRLCAGARRVPRCGCLHGNPAQGRLEKVFSFVCFF